MRSKTGVELLMMGMASTAVMAIRSWMRPNHPTRFFRLSMKAAISRLPMPIPRRKAVRMVVNA